MPNAVIAPGVRKNTTAKGASTAATGAVLTYTAPANKAAEVTAYFDDAINAAVAASPEHVTGGNTFRPYSTMAAGAQVKGSAASSFSQGGIMLAAGESFRWNVTTALAATTADFAIYILEEA